MKEYEKLPRIDIKPELPKNKKLKELFELVKNNTQIYDSVIWLLDPDVILRYKQVDELKKYAKQLKENSRATILVNNPCLEFWFLLHFRETSKKYSKCHNVIKDLIRYNELKDYEKTEKCYKNAKNNIYKRLNSNSEPKLKLPKNNTLRIKQKIFLRLFE